MTLGPLDLHEIGEAVSEALPSPELLRRTVGCPECEHHFEDVGPAQWPGFDTHEVEALLSELQRRGWSLVRSEGDR